MTPDHAARLAAGAACLEAALTVYLPREIAVTCCCDPDHIGVGKNHAADCPSPGKAPMHTWKDLQTRLNTADEVRQLWRDFPIGNVGCVLGQASGLVRIDVDGPEGETVLQAWSSGNLPPTWTFRSSPAGRGVLYAWPKDVPCTSTAMGLPGDHAELRLMGNGSQTVLPPSRHPSGSVYAWEPGCGPEDIPLAPAPAWLVERLRVSKRQQTGPLPQSTAIGREVPDAALVSAALFAIPNNDVPYETWLTLGMALHSLGTPWGEGLWESWSQQSAKYHAGKQAKSWESFTADGTVQIDNLFALARQQGWQPPQQGPAQPTPPQADALPWTDYTNALALVRDYGANLRYCWPWKSWLIWTGTHWERDTSGTVMQYAKATMKRLARQVEYLDDPQAAALMKHIKASLSTAKLKAMVECAQDEPGIPVQPEALDADPWVLNCQNGTLDLQTGTLRPHRQADLLSKCLAIPYDAAATCPTWEHFQWRIMGGSGPWSSPDDSAARLEMADICARRLIDFKQRVLGYSLTGDTREQCLFIMHGPGSNGKSTELETLQALLGEYAKSTPSASLLAKDRHDGIPNDIARLRGARLVTTVEVGEGKRLNEELVKRLTGQDTMTARFLFAEFFDFTPEFKLFIACNHLPTIRGTDHAVWRRIRLIPFTVTIPDAEQDKALPATLREELPGILAWAVRGCHLWRSVGLEPPEEVLTATKGYRESMDVFEGFLTDQCVRLPGVQATAADLYSTYERWCQANDVEALTKRAFGLKLAESGFTPDKATNGTRIWTSGSKRPVLSGRDR